jgi:hypothetical protein
MPPPPGGAAWVAKSPFLLTCSRLASCWQFKVGACVFLATGHSLELILSERALSLTTRLHVGQPGIREYHDVFSTLMSALVYCRRKTPTPTVCDVQCIKCGRVKSAEWFYTNTRASTGINRVCMPCVSHYEHKRSERLRRESDSQEPTAVKECGICGDTLPATSFSKHITCKDGLRWRCKMCYVQYKAAWRQERKEHLRVHPLVAPAATERICSRCRISKLLPEYAKNSISGGGVHNTCRECDHKRHQSNRLQTPTHVGN